MKSISFQVLYAEDLLESTDVLEFRARGTCNISCNVCKYSEKFKECF